MKKINAEKSTALGGMPPYNLVAVEEAYDWSSGTKGNQIGINYTILRGADMEKQRVFVRGNVPIVDAESVLVRVKEFKFVLVDFDGLTASVSADKNGNIRIYAEAEAVRVVQPQATAPRA